MKELNEMYNHLPKLSDDLRWMLFTWYMNMDEGTPMF